MDESNSYDHNSISKIELKETEVNLREAFENVGFLFDKYLYFTLGNNAAKNEVLVDKEINFFWAVEDKFDEGLKSIEKYELACEIGEKVSLQNVARDSFEIALNDVQTTLDAEDVDVQRKASTVSWWKTLKISSKLTKKR